MSDELWSLRNEVTCLKTDLANMAKARERQETYIKELEGMLAQYRRLPGTIWEGRGQVSEPFAIAASDDGICSYCGRLASSAACQKGHP